MQDQASSDYAIIDEIDVVNAWRAWTNKPGKLNLGTDGCGSARSCVIIADDNVNLLFTNCTVPDVPPGGAVWAQTHILAGSYRSIDQQNPNSPCNLGSPTYPIFVIALNTSYLDANNNRVVGGHPWWSGCSTAAGPIDCADKRLRVGRHEMGHALNLRDTYYNGQEWAPCWNDWGFLMPLMHNRSLQCDVGGGLRYPKNWSATFNEAVSVVIRANW